MVQANSMRTLRFWPKAYHAYIIQEQYIPELLHYQRKVFSYSHNHLGMSQMPEALCILI